MLTGTVQSNSDGKTQNQPTASTTAMNPPSRPLARSASGGSTYNRAPQTPNQQQNSRPSHSNSAQFNGVQNQAQQQGQRPPAQQFNQNRQQQHNNSSNSSNNHNNHSNNTHSSSSSTTANSSGFSHHTSQQPHNTSMGAGAGAQPGAGGAGFFSARAVKEIPEDALATGATLAPQAGQVFNPRAESPSIRKTPGIDHTKSKPLARNGQHIAPPSTQEAVSAPGAIGTAPGVSSRPVLQQQPRPGNVVNPHFDAARRIGAPGGPGSPLANRGQYRPPTIVNKRPLDGGAAGVVQGRTALADVSNNAGGTAAMGISGPDVKRLKTG